MTLKDYPCLSKLAFYAGSADFLTGTRLFFVVFRLNRSVAAFDAADVAFHFKKLICFISTET